MVHIVRKNAGDSVPVSVEPSNPQFSVFDYLPFNEAWKPLRKRILAEHHDLASALSKSDSFVLRLDRGLPRELWLILVFAKGCAVSIPTIEKNLAGSNEILLTRMKTGDIKTTPVDRPDKILGRCSAEDLLERGEMLLLSLGWLLWRNGVAPEQVREVLSDELGLDCGDRKLTHRDVLDEVDNALHAWPPLNEFLERGILPTLRDWDSADVDEGPVLLLRSGMPRSLWSVMLYETMGRDDGQTDEGSRRFAEWLDGANRAQLYRGQGIFGLPAVAIADTGLTSESIAAQHSEKAWRLGSVWELRYWITVAAAVWLAFMAGLTPTALRSTLEQDFPA